MDVDLLDGNFLLYFLFDSGGSLLGLFLLLEFGRRFLFLFVSGRSRLDTDVLLGLLLGFPEGPCHQFGSVDLEYINDIVVDFSEGLSGVVAYLRLGPVS